MTASRWTWWCGLILCGLGAPAVNAEVSREYLIKAAFLFNFTRFIEWPAASFADATSPIVIGVVGRNPFEAEIERSAKGRLVNGRAILVKSVLTEDDARTVHLLFLPAGEETRLAATAWRNASIVVVGESEESAALGGTIVFLLEGGKVRFEINIAAAERSRVRIGAQLQQLATAVRRQL